MIPLNPGTGPLLVLADASLRSIVLFLGGLLVLLALRTRRAAVRHAVWTVVACGMLVLPILSLSVPAIPLRLLPAPPLQFDPPVVAEQPVAAGAPAAVVANPGFPDWRVVGAAGWLVVALILFGRMILGYFFARRLFRRGTPVELPPEVADLAGRSRYDLREAASISVPLTFGWLRSMVLLPAGWRTWDHAKLRAVTAHELAHVRRSDWLVMLLASLNKCVFWFHPLAWWLERRLGTLAEEACDDDCLLALDNREQYAQALLEMAAAVRNGQGRLGWEAMAMARASQVRKRLERVLDETRKVLPGLSRARWSAAVLCAAPVVCGLAVLQLAPAQTVDMNWSGVPAAAIQAPRDPAPARVAPQPQQAAPTPAGPTAYTIRTGDRLNIAVWGKPDLSCRVTVGPDGKVTVPLLGELQAAGLTVQQLAGVATKGFAEFIVVPPEVLVSVVRVNDDDARSAGTAEPPRQIVRRIKFHNFEGFTLEDLMDRLPKPDTALAVEQQYRPEAVEEARRLLGEMFAERGQPDVRVKVEISDIPPRSIQVVFTAYRP